MTFDITDGRNRYKPCSRCGAEIGMGLTSSKTGIAVECAVCGLRGPESAMDGRWTPDHDREAFEAWNALHASGQEERGK